MSTDALLIAARDLLAGLAAEVRGKPAGEDPAILHRIGRLDIALAAARAAAEAGHADPAAVLVAGLLRDIARDFPSFAVVPDDLLGEDRRRRRLAREALGEAA